MRIRIYPIKIGMADKLLGKFYIVDNNGPTAEYVSFKNMIPEKIYEFNGKYVFLERGKLYRISTDEFTIWKIVSSKLPIRDAIEKFGI